MQKCHVRKDGRVLRFGVFATNIRLQRVQQTRGMFRKGFTVGRTDPDLRFPVGSLLVSSNVLSFVDLFDRKRPNVLWQKNDAILLLRTIINNVCRDIPSPTRPDQLHCSLQCPGPMDTAHMETRNSGRTLQCTLPVRAAVFHYVCSS